MEGFKRQKISELKKYIKNYYGVKNYRIKVKAQKPDAGQLSWHVRDTVLIKLWVRKDQFEAYSVMQKLISEDDFKDKIDNILKGTMVPFIEIYYF